MQTKLIEAEKLLSEPKKYLYSEMSFHDEIFKASGNRILSAMMMSINNLLLDSREKTVLLFKDLETTLVHHYKIFNAISIRDVEGAKESIKFHIEAGKEYIFSIIFS